MKMGPYAYNDETHFLLKPELLSSYKQPGVCDFKTQADLSKAGISLPDSAVMPSYISNIYARH